MGCSRDGNFFSFTLSLGHQVTPATTLTEISKQLLDGLALSSSQAAATDRDELADTVTSYISLCEDMFVPTKTFSIYNNNKPWFTAELRQFHQAKEEAYRREGRILHNQARNTITKEIRVAKRSYTWKAEKLVFSISVGRLTGHYQLQETLPHAMENHGWQLHPLPPSHPSPLIPDLHSGSLKRMCVSSFRVGRSGRHQAQTACHLPVWKPVLNSWPPS